MPDQLLASRERTENKIKRKRKLVANLILTPSILYTRKSPIGTFCIRKAQDAEVRVCNVPVLQQTDKAM